MLWIPDTAKELLAVDLQEASTANDDDWNDQIFVNQSIINWLNGQLDTGTLTDILLHYEIDPKQHLDGAEDYIEQLIRL